MNTACAMAQLLPKKRYRGYSPIMAMPGLYAYTIETSKSRVWKVSMRRSTCYICMNTSNQQKSENALFTRGDTAVRLPPNIVEILYIHYSIPVWSLEAVAPLLPLVWQHKSGFYLHFGFLQAETLLYRGIQCIGRLFLLRTTSIHMWKHMSKIPEPSLTCVERSESMVWPGRQMCIQLDT